MFGRSNPETEGNALVARVAAIKTREDFHRFAELLSQNFKKRRNEWENDKLDTFLSAIAALSGDFDGYVKNTGNDPTSNPWRLLATVLLGAKVYE